MLLPSDVARLVLGYLQDEGLSATSQAFINESPNLKEYADHTTGDGTIPACVFSIFGKGLTTILNEYVAAKAKESCHEVPAMMTSLWKKLDFTLNQIKSLQNSPALSASQRTRTRVGLANMARQRALTLTSASAVVCSSVSDSSSIISPAHTSHSMLGHSTPVSYSTPYTRPATGSSTHTQIHDISQLVSTPRDSPVQIIVSEHRLNPGPMSPGRRKWDTPRKRGGAPGGSSGPGRGAVASSSQTTESQPEEVVDENFPQLVIQNARDKILGDRSLQEKLAENINKILASDQTPQASKPSVSTVEADQSIDEILGLQGEIHMSDDAIHDILEQTESDPAFQALFDLFDYNKTKSLEDEAEDGNVPKGPNENDAAGASAAVRPLQSEDPSTTQKDDQTTTPSKTRTPDPMGRKTRKPSAPTLIKKIVCAPGSRSSRIENSSARLLLAPSMQQGISCAEKNSNRKVPASLPVKSVSETPMDMDEPLNTPPAPSDIVAPQEPASALTTTALSDLTTVPSSRASAAFVLSEITLPSNMDKNQDPKQIQGTKEQSAPGCSNAPACLTPVQHEVNSAPPKSSDLPHMLLSSSADTQQVFTPSSASSTSSTYATGTAVCAIPSPASSFPSLMTSGLPTPATTSTATPTPAPSASPASIPSYAPVVAAPDPSSDNPSTPNKAAADSNIVSLKIIIDNQDEHSSSDTALNQAISSISGENIPTIYLSSPVKCPAVPVTPKASLDEAALAVSGLQSSEGHASPLSIKAGAVVASPLTGTSQAQQNYIIQLPLDGSSHSIQGAAASYYLVTDPPTTDTQTRQVLLSTGISKGQSVPTNQYGVTPPTCSPGFSTGSTFILPSTVKPMMLPVSVVGQKTLGAVQMVPNQLVAISNPVPVQQSLNTQHKNPKVVIRKSKTAGTEQHPVDKLAQPVSAEATGQQNSTKAPKHRRILCFDSSAEVQQTTKVALPPATKKSPSQPAQQTGIDNSHSGTRTKPNILSGSKPKRRVHPVRCPADSQAGAGFVKEAERLVTSQHQKDPAQKSPGQLESQSASTSKEDESKLEPLKKSDSGRKSQSTDRKHSPDKDAEDAMAKDSHRSRSSSSDAAPKSGARKEKEDSSRKEQVEKASGKSREGHTEKRTSSQGVPHMTANKENEIKGSTQEQSTSSSSASRDQSSPAGTQSTCNTQAKATKAPSKTSSLAKQAAEMLQDIQAHNSPATPIKGAGAGAGAGAGSGSADSSLPSTPGTGVSTDELVSSVRTPSRQKKGKDREGTPKRLMPPNTPDAPTCSPASEAGSENSINMAAHTLMILSRAAIARTGSPLKDSLRQEGVGEKSSTSSKTAKKRKPSSPAASPPAKKERERKKLMDCFPHDLDVDKFLSSLHYDE